MRYVETHSALFVGRICCYNRYMAVLSITSLENTSLFRALGPRAETDDAATEIVGALPRFCQEAADRLKAFPTLHGQYTLHDETHCLRVVELMGRLIPKDVLEQLNAAELALLIMSAYFHDQGMVLSDQELRNLDDDLAYRVFRGNWEVEHPNLGEVRMQLQERNASTEYLERCRAMEHELLDAMLTDYVRQTHGERSATYVRTSYGSDPRLVIKERNVADLLGMLCESHVRPVNSLSQSGGFRQDEEVGTYHVNMSYLAALLRLADILDLDRDRTPNSLYRSIHFTSDVSLREWAKHRSVEGWTISSKRIGFTMRCTHPEYQRTALQFMDSIDQELHGCKSLIGEFPAPFAHYKLALPDRVDRSRIEPATDSRSGKPLFKYEDLEFSLSRDEIVACPRFMYQPL